MGRPKFTMDNGAAPAAEFTPADNKPEISPDLTVEGQTAGGPVTSTVTPPIPSEKKEEIIPANPPAVPETVTTNTAIQNTPASVEIPKETPAPAPKQEKKEESAPTPIKYVMPVFNIGDSKVAATKCGFKVSAKVFSAFLKSISLGKIIKDSYLEVLPNNTMISAFAEPASQAILGFLAVDSITTVTPGQLLLTNMEKLTAIVKTMENKADDTILIEYENGKIVIHGGKGKKGVELTGVQEQYVTSLKGLVNKTIDIENKKIGKMDFSGFTQFETDISMFTEILEAAKAINLPAYRFEINEGSASVRVVITNAQDKYELDYEPQNFIRNGASFKVTFSPGVAEVVSLFTGTVKVYMSSDCMIIGQHNMWYLIMPVA